MNWHYSAGGQSFGPVTESDLDALVRTGTIQPGSLVWHPGLATWLPYAEARGAVHVSAPAPPVDNAPPVVAHSACVECGVVAPVEVMVALGGGWMCAKCKPAYLQRLLQGTGVPVERMPSAGFWLRAGAKLLDVMFLGGAIFFGMFLLAIVMGIMNASGGGLNNEEQAKRFAMFTGLVAMAGTAGVTFLYAVLSKSATPGKRICGLRIVDREGAPIGRARAAGRFLVEAAVLSVVLFAEIALGTLLFRQHANEVGMIGTLLWPVLAFASYLTVLLNPERRSLHDLVCGTRVVVK